MKKLNEMYQEIANHINDMIPTEWEQVYTMAYIDEEGGSIFNYTKLDSDNLHYYTDIPKDYNVSEKRCLVNYLFTLYKLFKDSESYFIETIKNYGHHVNLIFTEGKLNVSFDYIEWKNQVLDL